MCCRWSLIPDVDFGGEKKEKFRNEEDVKTGKNKNKKKNVLLLEGSAQLSPVFSIFLGCRHASVIRLKIEHKHAN